MFATDRQPRRPWGGGCPETLLGPGRVSSVRVDGWGIGHWVAGQPSSALSHTGVCKEPVHLVSWGHTRGGLIWPLGEPGTHLPVSSTQLSLRMDLLETQPPLRPPRADDLCPRCRDSRRGGRAAPRRQGGQECWGRGSGLVRGPVSPFLVGGLGRIPVSQALSFHPPKTGSFLLCRVGEPRVWQA